MGYIVFSISLMNNSIDIYNFTSRLHTAMKENHLKLLVIVKLLSNLTEVPVDCYNDVVLLLKNIVFSGTAFNFSRSSKEVLENCGSLQSSGSRTIVMMQLYCIITEVILQHCNYSIES